MRFLPVLALLAASCASAYASGSMSAVINARQERFAPEPLRLEHPPSYVAPSAADAGWKPVEDSTPSAATFEKKSPPALLRVQVIRTQGISASARLSYFRSAIGAEGTANVGGYAQGARGGGFFTWRSKHELDQVGAHLIGSVAVRPIPGSRGRLLALCYGEFAESSDDATNIANLATVVEVCGTVTYDDPPGGTRSELK